MRKECPHSDQRQAHKVRKQQRGHRRSAIDQLVEEAVTRFNKICLNVKPESQYADQGLRQHHDQAHIHESSRHGKYERNDQEAGCKRRGDDRNPFGLCEESIRRMIGQRQDKISEEAAQRQKDHPSRPLRAARAYHPIHQKKKSQSGICQRRCKWRRIRKALQSAIEKESALQVVENAAQSNQDRKPADQIADIAPRRFEVPNPAQSRSSTTRTTGAPMEK